METFDGPLDYSTDVAWSPSHPAVFASADLSGVVRLYHILRDTAHTAALHVLSEAPAAATSPRLAATRLRFSPDGCFLAAGDASGRIHVLEPAAELVTPASRGEDSSHVAARWSRPDDI